MYVSLYPGIDDVQHCHEAKYLIFCDWVIRTHFPLSSKTCFLSYFYLHSATGTKENKGNQYSGWRKDTPICVPSQANIFGLCPQYGSISLWKSILKADSHPKNQPIKVFTDMNGCESEYVVLYTLTSE